MNSPGMSPSWVYQEDCAPKNLCCLMSPWFFLFFLMNSLGNLFFFFLYNNPSGMIFLSSDFQRKPLTWIAARVKHCCDQSPKLSCGPINSSPKWDPSSSPGPADLSEWRPLRNRDLSSFLYLGDSRTMRDPGLTPQFLSPSPAGNI